MKNTEKKNTMEYSFYSRVLKKPFDSIDELKTAEAAYFEKLKAKEDKVAQKRADAKTVEDAFKAYNAAKKTYNEELAQLIKEYAEALENLKKAYDLGKKDLKSQYAAAETNYLNALQTFTSKYPEGYHLTLKDGDIETTISSTPEDPVASKDGINPKTLSALFDILFD